MVCSPWTTVVGCLNGADCQVRMVLVDLSLSSVASRVLSAACHAPVMLLNRWWVEVRDVGRLVLCQRLLL